MTLNEYQKQAFKTALYPKHGTGSLLALAYCALGLAGEAGEVANKTKKLLRDYDTIDLRARICQEIGDTLWYAAALATEFGVSLDDIAENNLKKLANRNIAKKIKGEGDDR